MTSNPVPHHDPATAGGANVGGVDVLPEETFVPDRCPALAQILDNMSSVDRTIADTIRLLMTLQSSGEVVQSTGIGLELWLSQSGRATFSDRRMLQTSATILARVPNTMSAFQDGRLSWSQVRTIVLSVRQLSVEVQRAVGRGSR